MKFKDFWKKQFGVRISAEDSDAAKYRQMAEETSDQQKAAVLNHIAEDEDRHKKLLEEIGERTEKSEKMSDEELIGARALIALYNKKGEPAFKTIIALQKKFGKLATRSEAARVYWTEVKRADTEAVADLGGELGFDRYKMVLSPSACAVCRRKTENGNKVFTDKEIEKSGYGHKPPFHPSCYCIMVPFVE